MEGSEAVLAPKYLSSGISNYYHIFLPRLRKCRIFRFSTTPSLMPYGR